MSNESTEQDDSPANGLATDDEDSRVRAWRAEQLERLGLSRLAAHTFAPLVDWHDVAALVDHGHAHLAACHHPLNVARDEPFAS